MLNSKQTNLRTFGVIVAALTMGFASLVVHAVPVSYEMDYDPFFPNNVNVHVEIFLDDADIITSPGAVPLTSVDVTWQKGLTEVFFSFPNTQVGSNGLPGGSAFFAIREPFTGFFVGGELRGLNGLQEPAALGIANFRVGTPVPVVGGSQASTLFIFGQFPGEPNGTFDRANLVLSSISGPTPVGHPIPEPATLALFGLGLAGLGFSRRRKV